MRGVDWVHGYGPDKVAAQSAVAILASATGKYIRTYSLGSALQKQLSMSYTEKKFRPLTTDALATFSAFGTKNFDREMSNYQASDRSMVS